MWVLAAIIAIAVVFVVVVNVVEAQQPLEKACVIAWQWLSPYDEVLELDEFTIVTNEGEFNVVSTRDQCEPDEEDEDSPPPDDRKDWTSQVAAIYGGGDGAELYCVDAEGQGTLGLTLDETTESGVDFGCGTFYKLETGEYQLTLADGVMIVADNLWFIGAYYIEPTEQDGTSGAIPD